MSDMKEIYLIVFCITLQFAICTSTETVWKTLLSPTNPPLLRVRNFNEARGLTKYAVLDFVGLVEQYSYPAEEHKLITEDGYHLVIHRIPSSPYANNTKNNKIVYLQHGLMASSDCWVLIGPGKDLAFLLADNGYDVWVGNVRGNTYCRSHETMTPADKQFWDFSFHEHAVYDLRTAIDYILKHTGHEKLSYIGHSMGTTMSYILLSVRPEYNQKMDLVVNLSPVAFWNHGLSPAIKHLVDSRDLLKVFFDANDIHDVGAQSTINLLLADTFCSDRTHVQVLCTALMFLVNGADPPQTNTTILPYLLAYFPAGTSVKSLDHYYQTMVTGNFQFFDYGFTGNYHRYKKKVPPLYDLKKITAPFAIFYARNDAILSPENAKELANHLSNVVTFEEVPFDLFNHLDFIIANDAKILIYDRIIEIMNRF